MTMPADMVSAFCMTQHCCWSLAVLGTRRGKSVFWSILCDLSPPHGSSIFLVFSRHSSPGTCPQMVGRIDFHAGAQKAQF